MPTTKKATAKAATKKITTKKTSMRKRVIKKTGSAPLAAPSALTAKAASARSRLLARSIFMGKLVTVDQVDQAEAVLAAALKGQPEALQCAKLAACAMRESLASGLTGSRRQLLYDMACGELLKATWLSDS